MVESLTKILYIEQEIYFESFVSGVFDAVEVEIVTKSELKLRLVHGGQVVHFSANRVLDDRSNRNMLLKSSRTMINIT